MSATATDEKIDITREVPFLASDQAARDLLAGLHLACEEREMEWGAVSIVLILASGEPDDGSTRAITQALHAALSPDADITVKSALGASSDDADVARVAQQLHADYVCVVSWTEQKKRAVVRFGRASDARLSTRELRFDVADAASERGRTVGFTLASMAPDDMVAPPEPKSKQASEEPSRVDRPPVFIPPAAPAELGKSPAGARWIPRQNPLALEAAALAADAPGGYGGGIGGSFGVRIPLTGALGLHTALSGRVGSIGPAAASSHIFTAAAGMAWQPWLDPARRWAAGARADVLVSYLDVDHLDEDDTEARHLSRFLPGAEALVEGTYRFTSAAAAVIGGGAEVQFGQTDLFLHQRKVASILPTTLVLEVGLRVLLP